ncbi:MAG: hypothetical protein ACREIU_11005 [Planctomycetota bacterium]
MNRSLASSFLFLLPLAAPAPAQEEAPPPRREEAGIERDWEEIGKRIGEIVERSLAELGRTLEAHFDPDALAAEARERFGLSPEEAERARVLLAENREAHLGRKSAGSEADSERRREAFRSRAVEALGSERGGAFADWLEARNEALGERIVRNFEPLGREIARNAERLAGQIVETVVPKVEAEAVRAAVVAERAAREAVAEVRRALADVNLEVLPPAEEGPEGSPQDPSRPRRASSRPSVIPDRIRIERTIRESLREAERGAAEAERELRAAIERATRGIPQATGEAQETIRRAVEEAMREFRERQGEFDRTRTDAVERALSEAARRAEEAARRARSRGQERIESGRHAEEEAIRRARELDSERLEGIRSRREGEGEELRRARSELERLQRRIEELEQGRRQRATTRPARSSI